MAGAVVAHAAGAAEPTLHVVQADAMGRFELLGVRAGASSPLCAGAFDKAPWSGTVAVEAGCRAFVEIRLLPACSLRGVVRDDDGRCVAGPELTVVEQDGRVTGHAGQRCGWNRPRVEAGEDGGYLVTNMRPGRVRVAFEDRQVRCEYLELDIAPGEDRAVDVVLSRPRAIGGNVVDADGVPLVGWSVDAWGPPGARTPRSVVTGRDGGFSITTYSPAAHVLTCSSPSPGAPAQRWRDVIPGGEPVLLRVSRDNVPNCFLRGTLVAEMPARVSAVLCGGPAFRMQSQTGGTFAFGPLPAGRFSLRAILETGSERLTMPITVGLGSFELGQGQVLDLGNVCVPAPGEVEVQLQGIDGSPLTEGRCNLTSVDTQDGAIARVVAGSAVFRVGPGSYLVDGDGTGVFFELAAIEVRSGERTLVRLRAMAGVQRILRCEFAAEGVPSVRGILRKNGVAMRSISPFVEVPFRCTPGQWELELRFADGRMERFPFLVTADVEAPPIEIRVPR